MKGVQVMANSLSQIATIKYFLQAQNSMNGRAYMEEVC